MLLLLAQLPYSQQVSGSHPLILSSFFLQISGLLCLLENVNFSSIHFLEQKEQT